MRKLLIAGGGTGGHLFPGIAIAKAFMSKSPTHKVLFVSTGNAFECRTLSQAGFEHRSIRSEGIKGYGFLKKIQAIVKIPKSIAQSLRIILQFKPDLVLGVGGYSSGPVLIAAWLMMIPIVLQEQNTLPGMTNRILAWFANRIYLSFEGSARYFNRFLHGKLRFVGNPVREEILASQVCKTEKNRRFTVLILGGSQGAHAINLAVIESLQYLENKQQYFFIHQTGIADETAVTKAYADYGIRSMVNAFFEDMGNCYRQADMVIARAGATTVAEISAVGKAAIFIPYPFAADNHQMLNAESLADHHAAEIIVEKELNGRILAEKIRYYASEPEKLALMSASSRFLGKPHAANVIAEDILSLT